MEFSSITFLLIFLPTVILTYFVSPKRFRNIVLLIFSFIFYAWTDLFYLPILIVTILLDYCSGRLIFTLQKKKTTRNIVFIATLFIHLLILLQFKYQLLPLHKICKSVNILSIENLIPIGISIYSLQGLSYIIDLYLNKIKVQKNIIHLATYISFFPQLICGPIVRYSDMSNELESREENYNKISKGYSLFIRGLAKKIFLADNMLLFWWDIQEIDTQSLPILTAWIGILAFSFAVYFYLSGYSEMARGIGKIFGFELPINFNYPYIAKSVSEFWRRWNTTLTVWCKTYIFTAFGKNKGSFFLITLKLLGLWVLTGLWYGHSLNFVLWGLFLGIIIIFEKIFWGGLFSRFPSILQKLYTRIITLLAWVIFAIPDIHQIPKYLQAMFSGKWVDNQTIYLTQKYILLFVICFLCCSNFWYILSLKYEHKRPKLTQWTQVILECILTIVCLIYIISGQVPLTNFFVRF